MLIVSTGPAFCAGRVFDAPPVGRRLNAEIPSLRIGAKAGSGLPPHRHHRPLMPTPRAGIVDNPVQVVPAVQAQAGLEAVAMAEAAAEHQKKWERRKKKNDGGNDNRKYETILRRLAMPIARNEIASRDQSAPKHQTQPRYWVGSRRCGVHTIIPIHIENHWGRAGWLRIILNAPINFSIDTPDPSPEDAKSTIYNNLSPFVRLHK